MKTLENGGMQPQPYIRKLKRNTGLIEVDLMQP